MATLRDIKRRIKSVKNTQQITKAMKMVAAAKLRRAQEAILKARPYSYKMKELVQSLKLRAEEDAHPLLTPHEGNRLDLIVVTADKGLCGAFNANICRRTVEFVEENKDKKEITLTLCGKKARDFFNRRNYEVRKVHLEITDKITYKKTEGVINELIEMYEKNETDDIRVIYNEFKSAIQQRIIIEKILPFEPLDVDEGKFIIDYLYEPDQEEIFRTLLTRHINVQLFRIFLESASSEHGARMTAMEAATNNADEMIAKLTLKYNRLRQSNITTEIIEVVTGADALEGE